MGPHTLRRSLYPCPGAKDIDVREKKTEQRRRFGKGGRVGWGGIGGLRSVNIWGPKQSP